MKKNTLLILLLALVALVFGCATSKDVEQVERQTATINAELREVKGNLDEINFSLQAEEKRIKETLDAVQKDQARISEDLTVVKENQADLGSRIFSSKSPGEISGGQIEDLRHEVVNVNAKIDSLKAALLTRLDELEKAAQNALAGTPGEGGKNAPAAGAGKNGAATQPAATAAPPGDPIQMYQAAYLDYTKGNYDLAIQGFTEFLKAFPDAEYAGNAQYWIGESLYSLGKYEDAQGAFDKVIKNYPASSKVPGAMLKRGYCFDAMKKPKEAKEAYQVLIKKYPDSEAAKLAGERLKKK